MKSLSDYQVTRNKDMMIIIKMIFSEDETQKNLN